MQRLAVLLGVIVVLQGVVGLVARTFLLRSSAFAQVILGWWAEGGVTVVRAWALASLAIGVFIVYSTMPRRCAV